MKTISFQKEQGVSIRKLNIIMFILAAVASVVLFVTMRFTTRMNENTLAMSHDVIAMQQSANELMKASDYLTEQMRAFVVTGERKYFDNYYNEATVDRRRDKALLELKEKNGKSKAYSDLQKAMDDSMELMNIEYYAARLAIEGYGCNIDAFPDLVKQVQIKKVDQKLSKEDKIELAQALMFDDDYSVRKESISKYTNECLTDLTNELKERQETMAAHVQKQVWFEHFMTWVLIVITLAIVILTARLVIIPLNKAVARIREEKDIPLEGAYEIRFLAKTYNLMFQTNVVDKQKLNYEATHDKLTGLYNRRGYEFLLKNVDMESATLLVIDLDKFKQINDMYGHDMGDKALAKTGDVIFNSFRNQDYVCRIGGDEFAVIMVHCSSDLKELIAKKVDTMNDKLQNALDGVPAITISVGVAFGETGESVDKIFKNADAALYEAKQSGRCCVKFAKDEK